MNNIELDKQTRTKALNPAESFIVQAPAGSGKTELLIQRYLRLLACVEKAPEEVIAITFTRKAAAEMRERVMQALTLAEETEPELEHKKTTWRLANAVVDVNKKLNWQLEKNPNRLRIMTIDSLTAMLNAQIPLLSGFGAGIDIIEEPRLLYRTAVERLFQQLKHKNNNTYHALSTLLLHFDNNAEQLAGLLEDLLSQREQWLPHIISHYREPNLLRKNLEKSLYHINEETIERLQTLFPEKWLSQSIALLIFTGKAKQFNNTVKDWQALADLFLTETCSLRKSIDKRHGFPAKSPEKARMFELIKQIENHEELIAALNAARQCPPSHYNSTQWQVIEALLDVLPILTAELNLLFQEHGAIDFTEQTLGALRALGDEENPTELALHLDYQIKHILIDEFQDTSVIQFHLIEKLISEWQPNDERSLFIVGDPMQSIYRFRQAEVGLFMRLQQQPIQNIQLTPLRLYCNFRSEQGIIDWINSEFKPLFPKTMNISEGTVPYAASTPIHQTSVPQNVAFYNHLNASEIDEATHIANLIKQTNQQHPRDTLAILVRSRSHLKAILPILRKQNIAFDAVDIEPLGHFPEIQDLLSLTKALLHLNDRIAWFSVLRSPCCGLTLHDLHQLALNDEKLPIWWLLKNAKNLTCLSNDGQKRVKKIIAVLSQAFAEQAQLNLSHWIERTWFSLGGPNVLNSTQALQQCHRFFEILQNMETDFALTDFIEKIEREFTKQTTQPTSNIQILTIHKSKGLEFDHVFIPHMQKKNRPESPKLLQWLERVSLFETNDLVLAPIRSKQNENDKIYHYLRDVEKNKLKYEQTRLLYVACTRAKKTLHLSAFTADDELKIKLFSNAFRNNPITHESTHETNTKTTTYLTRLADLDCIASQEISYETNNANETIPITEKKNLIARITGTVIHSILEHLSYNIHHQWDSARNQLIELGLPLAELDAQLEVIKQAINKTLASERGRWILQPRQDAQSEYAITTTIHNKPKTYIVDRTFIDEKGTRWIIDYKTGDPNDSLQSHLAQLNEYAKLIQQIDSREINLGLYFPLHDHWTSWHYKETQCLMDASD